MTEPAPPHTPAVKVCGAEVVNASLNALAALTVWVCAVGFCSELPLLNEICGEPALVSE
jgi:hypothetical protein